MLYAFLLLLHCALGWTVTFTLEITARSLELNCYLLNFNLLPSLYCLSLGLI